MQQQMAGKAAEEAAGLNLSRICWASTFTPFPSLVYVSVRTPAEQEAETWDADFSEGLTRGGFKCLYVVPW